MLYVVPYDTLDQHLFVDWGSISYFSEFVGGSLGNLIRGAGHEDALSLIYGPNISEYVLSGCSYECALWTHLPADVALHNILLKALHVAKGMMRIICCCC